MRRILLAILAIALPFFCPVPAAGQTLMQDLQAFVETPAVTGYEQTLAAELRARLKNFAPQTDNLGNVYVTLGSGLPSRLIVAAMDEPGYVVSGITAEGYLRVQRLPQQPPHALFDLLHAAQPVVIHTRKGKWVSGVVAGLSTHLQPARRDAPRGAHPDEMYIDIGAASAAEVRQAGVDLLDPIALERRLYLMGSGRMTAPAVGDRFGCAALVELLRRIDRNKLRGTLTVAFVAQQRADSRGLDRLLQHRKADELIYVGRLGPQRGLPRAATEESPTLRQPRRLPGEGVLIASADPDGKLAGLAEELRRVGEANKVSVATDFSAPLPRVRYTQGPTLPERFAHLGIPTRWTSTPAEVIASSDLENLISLLELHAQGTSQVHQASAEHASQSKSALQRPQAAPPAPQLLRELVEIYGASGHEAAVRETIARLLPPWAKPETDSAGNLILRVGMAAKGSKVRRIAFVAHMDEIGYEVRAIAEDGRLLVRSLGGGISEFFAGHTILVHTAAGVRPGVLELPLGWDTPGFEWSRLAEPGRAFSWRVDVGAGNPGEVEQLGIKVGDAITVPKRYRRLFGTRANGRSFDDRVGCAALLAAVWALGPNLAGRDVTFIWSTEEEVGLRGALAAAEEFAKQGRQPDYVFAVDTFVSSDSPLESRRFAGAEIGKGFVVRAVDNSNIVPREAVDRVIALARAAGIAVQYGVTGGGNDGAAFLRHGAVDVPIGWSLRYSHSPGEVIDTRDLEALARIVAVIARSW